jgi:hypothetical protein
MIFILPSYSIMQLFDISTTVDPSYIISLIRKLLPTDASNDGNSQGFDACVARSDHVEGSAASVSGNGVLNSSDNKAEGMDIVEDCGNARQGGEDEESCHGFDRPGILAGEEVWEECGCILWDLAASKANAELMVLKFSLLLFNLDVSRHLF